MAYREACKHLFISLGLWHTIGEKRFREQKGKEHIKADRSRYWDLILSGFTKSPQDTITSFFTQSVRGSCSQMPNFNGPIALRNGPTSLLCSQCNHPRRGAPSTRCGHLKASLMLTTPPLQGKHFRKTRKKLQPDDFLTKKPYFGDTTSQHRQRQQNRKSMPNGWDHP